VPDADGSRVNYFNYYTEIEDAFIRRRGKHLLLSPIDWALIEAWQERGIPLHIVLRAIESVFDVFDKQPAGTRSIKSLFYCREEVEIQHSEWLRSQTGIGGAEAAEETQEFDVELVRRHIAASIEKLQQVAAVPLAEDIGRAVARLEQLSRDLTDDASVADATLSDIEQLLERSMLSNWDKVHLKHLEKLTADELRQYKAEMGSEAYKNTFELMLLKRLREEAGIPRLGLYYL